MATFFNFDRAEELSRWDEVTRREKAAKKEEGNYRSSGTFKPNCCCPLSITTFHLWTGYLVD